MKKYAALLLIGFFFSVKLHSQECTHYWDAALTTDPLQAKGYSGDTNNGYGLFSVKGDNTTKFILKGTFPKARYISLQTYNTRLQRHVDDIADFEIEPDPGSQNPFRPGVPLDTLNRSYTLELIPERLFSGAPNQVKLPRGRRNHNFFYRIYSPSPGVKLTRADLPRVFAYDARTNRPKRCPRRKQMPIYLRLPQILVNLVSKFIPFEFREASGVIGSSSGIPTYLYALNKMKKGEVVAIRFKAPEYNDTRNGGVFTNDSEVRYWSMCLQNWVKNETLSCLPDFLATPDSSGMVNLIVGSGKAVKQRAEELGFNFLPDTRSGKQKVMGFAYRNLLARPDFAEKYMYQGDYYPRVKTCSQSTFLSGGCTVD